MFLIFNFLNKRCALFGPKPPIADNSVRWKGIDFFNSSYSFIFPVLIYSAIFFAIASPTPEISFNPSIPFSLYISSTLSDKERIDLAAFLYATGFHSTFLISRISAMS